MNATTTASDHEIVSRSEWLRARSEFLAKEKELTHLSDQLARKRQRASLDQGREGLCLHRTARQIEPGGSLRRTQPARHVSLHVRAGLGRGLSGLLVLDGSHGRSGRTSCGAGCLARARLARPLEKLMAFQKRMGWHFTWVSSAASDFNRDFGVYFTKEEVDSGKNAYNFATIPPHGEENPGLSCFYKDPSGAVFHTFSGYGRGLESMLGTYAILDRAPKGRDEEGLPCADVVGASSRQIRTNFARRRIMLPRRRISLTGCCLPRRGRPNRLAAGAARLGARGGSVLARRLGPDAEMSGLPGRVRGALDGPGDFRSPGRNTCAGR